MMYIVFSYFHQIMGPTIFLSVPIDLPALNEENILKLMDIDTRQGFFEFREQSGYANYKFDINSPLARGKKDLVMLTIVVSGKANLLIFNSILLDLAQNIVAIPVIYRLFYEKEENFTTELNTKKEQIHQLLITATQKIKSQNLDNNFGDILILGNDKAGKSSIIDRLINENFDAKRRETMSFQIIKTVFENIRFSLFDLGGKEQNKELWYKACKTPRAIIYVLDITADEKAFISIRKDLHQIIHYFKLAESNNNIPLLIMGNKCELQPTFSENDLIQKLNMGKFTFPFHIGLVSAKENQGIERCFKWLIMEFLQ